MPAVSPTSRRSSLLSCRRRGADRSLEVIKTADWIVDLGPEGGDEGGYVVAVGTPEEKRLALGLDPRVAANQKSYTGHYLKQALERRPSSRQRASGAAE